jgi:hypothetical protein
MIHDHQARREQAAARNRVRRERNRQKLVTGDNGRPYAAHVPPEQHGTEATYTNHGCECDPCLQASAEAHGGRGQ